MKKARARKPGRPTKYSNALSNKICARLATGRSLRNVCLDKGMPNRRSVFRWLRDNEEFRHQYEIAKEASADALAEDMLDIADDPLLHPQDKRVRIDTRKWIASKLKLKKYGHNRISSGDEDAPTIHRIV